MDEMVESALKKRGVEDIPDVVLLDVSKQADARKLRSEGTIALRKEVVLPSSTSIRNTPAEAQRRKLEESKAIAIVQLLHGWGLLEQLSFSDQERLVRDILEIVSF